MGMAVLKENFTKTGGGSDLACRSQFADSRTVTFKKNRIRKETKHRMFQKDRTLERVLAIK